MGTLLSFFDMSPICGVSCTSSITLYTDGAIRFAAKYATMTDKDIGKVNELCPVSSTAMIAVLIARVMPPVSAAAPITAYSPPL